MLNDVRINIIIFKKHILLQSCLNNYFIELNYYDTTTK